MDDKENPVLIDWESSGLVNPCEELIETAWNWRLQLERRENCFINFICKND